MFDIWYHFYISHISVRNGKYNEIPGNAEEQLNYFIHTYIDRDAFIRMCIWVCRPVCMTCARVLVLTEHFNTG